MPVYNLKRLTPVPSSTELVDIVLMRTQRKTPTVIHPGYKISRIRSFYMRKVKFTTQTISERLGAIVGDFPRLEEVHPFFGDLLGVLYDRDHYKLALGQLNTCKKLCETVCRDYVRLLKYADSLYRCKSLKVAALGRMMTLLKRQKASLEYLEEVRKHAGRLPALDPAARTLLVCGFPNVGKSSFMNKVTRAEVEVQPYAFTTKSLYVGHMDHRYLRWQVIDTPGILDHELEKRNVIEMQAVTALAHLPCAILFFVDVSEQCGYTLEQQASLYHSIRPLFADKQLVVVANKTDVIGLEELSIEHQELLKNMTSSHTNHDQEQAPLIEMSNVTETGVARVKDIACDLLLAARVDKRKSVAAGARVRDQMQRIVVAKPTNLSSSTHTKSATPSVHINDTTEAKACIPESVRAARRASRLAKKAQEAAEEASRVESALESARDHGAREAAVVEVSERAQKAKERAERLKAEAESSMTDSKPPTERELMWLGGGPGVYSADHSREYKGMLRNDEFASDVVPEIMDGKNVADFVDPDIITRLAQLEDEDLEAELALDEAERLEIEASLSPEELDLVLAIRAKRRLARQKSQAKQHTAQGNNIMPRSKRTRLEDDDLDRDDQPETARRARDAVVQRGRSRSRRADQDADDMDTTDDHSLPRRDAKRARTAHRSTSRPPPRSEAAYHNAEQKKTAQKIEKKMSRKISRLARAGEINRKTGPKVERWRVEGKMGLGTRNSR